MGVLGEVVAGKRVIIGGTFGFLHAGHKALLRKAFATGESVYIGLTTDAYVRRKKHSAMIPRYLDEALGASQRDGTSKSRPREFYSAYALTFH